MNLHWLLALAFALTLDFGCSSDDAAANRRTTRPPPRVAKPTTGAPSPATAELKPEMARPYFAQGRALEAARAFELEKWQPAESGFAALAASADSELGARALLMKGLAQAAQKKWRAAASTLQAALPGIPLLADYIHYQLARSYFFAKERAKALEHAKKVTPESIVGADAELLVGDLLRMRGETGAVADHYKSYRQRRPHGIRLAEAKYRQAEAMVEEVRASRRDAPALEEALALYRDIGIDAPLSAWAKRADKAVQDVVRSPPSVVAPANLRKATAALNADELIRRAMVYYKAMRNPLSEADFAAALSAPGGNKDNRCIAAYHRANSVFKQRQRRRAAPLFDAAFQACIKTDNHDLQVKSAYQAGRSYANIRERKKAIKRYREIEKRHPSHSYADDARLRQAEEYRDLGDEDRVTELLSTIPKLYPKGDMRAEAMWRLAWRAFKKRDHKEAIHWLEEQKRLVPIDDNYWAEGQAQYWLGRAWAEIGDTTKSLSYYQEAINAYPMSYYALLALNRLRDKHPDDFKRVQQKIAATASAEAKPLSFRKRELYSSAGFNRALEFLRLGLGGRAEAELRKLKFASPSGKSRVTDADEVDRIWALAYLYHLAGRYEHSHWVTRWHVLDYKRHWPTDAWRLHWDIAYPRAWWPLLDKWAKHRGHPTELQIAFVREESAFDPLRESYANAIGLTQMIFPTARRFAKGTGIKVSRDTLRDPEKNVTIGSNFLQFLMKRFERRIALVVPSYNAGEGATYRWLRERGSWPQDEWAEEIPYDQARNYSKRVIASYFAYSYLATGEIPEMPNEIPKSVMPKRRR